MKRTILCILYSFICIIAVSAQEFKNPIVFGNNRITLITPTLFRLEYAENGKFLDEPTLFAYDRTTLLQDFEVVNKGNNTYEIKTSAITMVYNNDKFPFGLYNFHVLYNMEGKEKKFTVRGRQSKNLRGTISTLDRVDKAVPLDEGLLSRDGWYIINDAGKDVLKNDWIERRSDDHIQDLYCFVYGTDYRSALKDLGQISGRVPMTRKYVHGVWYCRYWDYSADEYRQIVKEYAQNDFPIDNLVFDMGWHTQKEATVGTGHAFSRGWTGYTWNKDLIPDPKSLVKELKDDHIYVSLNDHPHDGIRPHEAMYADFMNAMRQKPDGETILFDAGNKRYMDNFLKYAHGESWNAGVSFWWLDWQQDYLYSYVRGLNKTSHLAWLNKLYYDESKRDGLRGAGYSRWAGWGDQRHPIQFSGDAVANWDVLAFEIELTATSGNAGCYYWAHDIGGFYGGKDSEMYARWTQFGALSAALRIHSELAEGLDRRPWLWGEQANNSMRKAYHLRAQLMPYVYSSIWQTHRTMVPLNRAMYIDFNSDERSYKNPQQFMFGDLLLAAPITSAGKGANLVAEQKVWFPEGYTWYDYFDGTAYKGGTEAKVSKNIDEFPLFVKGGYLLPMQPYNSRPASAKLDELVMRVYPGNEGADNTYTLYEDDGLTTKYEDGAFATTDLNYKRKGNVSTITISPATGTYDGQPKQRTYTIEIPVEKEIVDVTIDNKKVKAEYDTAKGMFVIKTKLTPITKSVRISYKSNR